MSKFTGAERKTVTESITAHKAIFTADETDISVIKFEGATVRIVNVYGDPWFVAVDFCQSLEVSNTTDAVSALDNDEVMTLTLIEEQAQRVANHE